LIYLTSLGHILKAIRVFEQLLAAEDMSFENHRLEGLRASSAFDLQRLLEGVLDAPQHLLALFHILELHLQLLHSFYQALFILFRYLNIASVHLV
jgi:hypothetical protein